MAAPRIPRATYRLQLNAAFTLRDAAALVPYLDDLGISHLYLSSFLAARPGSTHGYDITDHNVLNPEIGDEADLDALAAEAARRNMGIILDFIPNHMGIGGRDNAWWLDVLEWGEASPHALDFDIDWTPGRRELRHKVMVPFLGDRYGVILEKGELKPGFDRDEGSLSVWYWDHRLPLAPAHYLRVLRPAMADLGNGPAAAEFEEVLGLLRPLAVGRAAQRTGTEGRRRAAEAKRRLAELVARRPEVGDAIDAALERLGGNPGEPGSFGALHKLMEAQNWRASYWRVAADEINYRRFFDINDLAGLRIERPNLFETTHRLVFRLLGEGKIHGLRIDHIDGLFHPAQYCQRLQRRAAVLSARDGEEEPLYLLVEKILAHHERLRRDWPVAGTTGYEFMNLVNGLFVDGDNARFLETVYTRFTGEEMDFEREVYAAKKLIMNQTMASELQVLSTRLSRIAQSHWLSRDYTISSLRDALREVIAHFPVYRTYVTARRVSDQDRRYIHWAVAKAAKGAAEATIYEFIRDVLDTSLIRRRDSFYQRRAVVDFAMRLQQYTGPVMAKGFEDTALYRYNRLISLNEVGGEPTRFGISAASFHLANRERQRRRPHSMLATATHDSKRGEDVRVRIDVISELADEWRQHVFRWARLNQGFKRQLEGGEAPEPNDEYFLYQTLLGVWPTGGGPREIAALVDRLAEATVKAAREAKRRTSWAMPDGDYEQAAVEFVRRITETDRRNPFLDDFLPFQERVASIGMVNGLSQTLLKLTSPGVPDIYQGCELWQLSLVDPDNRRPVDYDLRRRLLDRARATPLPALLETWTDGAVKLAMIWRTLAFRRSRPHIFERGEYQPLQVRGERRHHICALARMLGGEVALAAVPLGLASLWPSGRPRPPMGKDWAGVLVELPKGWPEEPLVNLLTDETVQPVRRRSGLFVEAERMFATFPVALLAAGGGA